MAMDFYKSLRILALAEVVKEEPGSAYSIRQVFRWYSEKFHTPLHLVDELPLHDVMQHYFESNYEKLKDSPGALQEELIELSRTPEEEAAAKAKADREVFQNWKFEREAEEEAKVQQAAKAKKLASDAVKPKKPPVFSPPSASLRARMSSEESPIVPDLNKPPEPTIKMSFIDLDELEELSSSDSFGGEPLVGLK